TVTGDPGPARGGGETGARSCLLPGDRHQDRQRDPDAAPPTERPCGDLRIQGSRLAHLLSFLRSSSAGLLPSETAGYPSTATVHGAVASGRLISFQSPPEPRCRNRQAGLRHGLGSPERNRGARGGGPGFPPPVLLVLGKSCL